MKAMLGLVGLVAVLLVCAGCLSAPRQAMPNAAAIGGLSGDYVDAVTQGKAIERGALTIPDALAKVQDTGLAHFRQDDEVVLNPDGTVFLLDLGNGRKSPVFNRSQSYTKWSSLHEIAGAKMTRFFFGIGSLFGSRYDKALANPSGLQLPAGRRDGFILDIEGMEGSVTKSGDQLRAKYEGQAKLQDMLNQGAEVAWAGAKGYIEARADGTSKILATTTAGIREIVGEVIKITPYGAANSLGEKALKVVVKEAEADGTVKASTAASTVDVIPPSAQ